MGKYLLCLLTFSLSNVSSTKSPTKDKMKVNGQKICNNKTEKVKIC